MKKIYFSLIALFCSIAASAVTLYLTPNENWKVDDARFALYTWDVTPNWYDMVAVDGETDLYSVEIPDNVSNVIFCRMAPDKTANSWDNKWNQTEDLTYDGTNNWYTVKSDTWDKGGGTWAVYTPADDDTGDDTGDDSGDVTPVDSPWSLVGGAINGAANWDATAGEKFVDEDGDGVYTLTLNSLEGEFKVLKDATWEGSHVLVDNASTYFALDQTFTLENTEATGNIKLPLYHVWNGVVLTLDTTGAAVTLSATATEDVDNTPTSDHWSLVGSAINGAANWDNNNGLEFVEGDVEGVFTLTLESLSGEFKVLKNKLWAGSHILAESGVEFDEGQDYSLIQKDGAGNIVMVSGVTLTNVTLTLTVNGENVTLRADAEGSADTKDTYMIVGDFNSWTFENNPINLLDEDNDNVYVGTVAEMSGVHTFKVVKNSSWDTCYGTSGSNLVVGEAYMPSLTNSGNIAFADQSVVYKEVTFTFDATTETLTVTATSTESLVTTWTLVGDFNNWFIDTSLEFTATEDAGVYKLSLDELSGAFKVLKNNAWGGSYITSEEFTPGAEFVLENRDEAGYNITIKEGDTWKNVELTLTEGDAVTLSATAGEVSAIEGVEVESNEAVEYFNLQGVRVENPEVGLFIRKQGNKVTKVLVK